MDFRKLISTIDKLESKKTLTEVVHREVTAEPGINEGADYTLKFKKGSIAEALLDEKSQEGDELDALRSDPNSTKFKKAFGGQSDPETSAAAEAPTAAAADPAAAAQVATDSGTSAAEPASATAAVPPQTTNDIAKLQQLLNKYNTNLKVDGKLGPKTAGAILNYRTLVSKQPGGSSIVAAARGVESRYPTDVAAARKAMMQPAKSTQFKGSAGAASSQTAPNNRGQSVASTGSALVDRTIQAAAKDPERAVRQLNTQWQQARKLEIAGKTPAISTTTLQKAINDLEAQYPAAKQYMSSIRPVKFNIPTAAKNTGPFTAG